MRIWIHAVVFQLSVEELLLFHRGNPPLFGCFELEQPAHDFAPIRQREVGQGIHDVYHCHTAKLAHYRASNKPRSQRNSPMFATRLNHANVLHRSAVAPKGSVAELADELSVIRDRLFADAMSLANCNLIDGARLAQVKTAVGYRPLATDVFTLIAVLKERWTALQNKTPVTLEPLNDAGHRAVERLAAAGQREQAPVTVGEAVERRQRA